MTHKIKILGSIILMAVCCITVSSQNVSLTKGHLVSNHYAVDLGLSVEWATTDVGTDKPEGYGSWVPWGEIQKKDYPYPENYIFLDKDRSKIDKVHDKYVFFFSKYTAHGSDGYHDGKSVLDSQDDIATVDWGSDWRMPTPEECEELLTKCTWEKTTIDDMVQGYRVKGPNGNSIFIRRDGYKAGPSLKNLTILYLWSNRISDEDVTKGICIEYPKLKNSIVSTQYPDLRLVDRYYGMRIRPVHKNNRPSATISPTPSQRPNQNDNNNISTSKLLSISKESVEHATIIDLVSHIFGCVDLNLKECDPKSVKEYMFKKDSNYIIQHVGSGLTLWLKNEGSHPNYNVEISNLPISNMSFYDGGTFFKSWSYCIYVPKNKFSLDQLKAIVDGWQADLVKAGYVFNVESADKNSYKLSSKNKDLHIELISKKFTSAKNAVDIKVTKEY